jgi:hypothetical protein
MSKTLTGWIAVIMIMTLAYISPNHDCTDDAIENHSMIITGMDNVYTEINEDSTVIPVLVADETWYEADNEKGDFTIVTYSPVFAYMLKDATVYTEYNEYDVGTDCARYEFSFPSHQYYKVQAILTAEDEPVFRRI